MNTGNRGGRRDSGRAGEVGRRRLARALAATAVCTVALALAGCSGSAEGVRDEGPSRRPEGEARIDAEVVERKPVPSPTPTPPALKNLDGAKVNIVEGQTVGVGMPISVTFDHVIPEAERDDVERQLKVTTDPGVEGAWSWIEDRGLGEGRRVDFRPRSYWKPGTKVTVRVGAGITRHFTIGRSLIATIDVREHTMTVVKDGSTERVPVTAGAPGMDTWNGTMVVSDKQPRVFMDSRTVGYGDSYADWYSYAVHLTASGTYLHENPKANTYAGRRNVTHGCVGLADDGTAKRFYDQVIPGDVVKVVGSKETVAVGNGYGDWNLGWERWVAGSALT